MAGSNGLVAGAVWTALAITLVTFLAGDLPAAPPSGRHGFLLAGIWVMWLFAAIRPRFGQARSSALAGAVALRALITTLPAMIIATLVGIRFYEEET